MGSDQPHEFVYRRSLDQDSAESVHHRVIVVGAGPVGLSMAIDLAQRGIPVLVLDDDDTVSTGSRAICFAKRTLEIFDRLGCGQKMVDKGVSWNVGKVFLRDELIYSFDLLPEGGHHRPAFINLQQYYVEGYLVERADALPGLEIRWSNRVCGIAQDPLAVELSVDTPEGPYRLTCDYLVCADGSKSPSRKMLGLEARGHTFRDRFLIADVKMKAAFPSERWFWFDPPFHRNQSALLHRQPDNVWRIDFQLGWDADPTLERDPERVTARVRAMLGSEVEFELEWVSVYTFACTRMDRFSHSRVFFVGDAAHGVSPFGARGANGGVQDADNLAWKLAWVLTGRASVELLASYEEERIPATDENILNSTRSTDFITPKSAISRTFRDATLGLAKRYEFARTLVNSGRLSLPATYSNSPLNTADEETFRGTMLPGASCLDAPLSLDGQGVWLLDLLGPGFTVLYALAAEGGDAMGREFAVLAGEHAGLQFLAVQLGEGEPTAPAPAGLLVRDAQGLLAKRYDLAAGTYYLIRPDQHVCARGRRLSATRVGSALARAACTH
ncbi:MAG: FAD-dependent oxidoreductase [Burkholderiaceae bacterium]